MSSNSSVPPSLMIPELEPGEEWLNVILHFTHDTVVKQDLARAFPPIWKKCSLSDDIWIKHLDSALAAMIVEACSPTNFQVPIVGQQGHLYAFVRRTTFPGLFNDFGGMEELASVVALSRLVQPTTTGVRYAARVSLVNGVAKQILAYQPHGVSPDVFLSKNNRRDWLTEADAERIEPLMALILKRPVLPARVHNAYWHHEYAMRTYYVDHRWVFVSTGLDALVNTSRYKGEKKFVSKVKRLADSEGIVFTEDELERAYELRSGLVHGQQFLSDQSNRLSDAEYTLYDKMEETLRRVLIHSFEDASFAACFNDPQSIDKLLPYP
jgi:hypothetical protein